MNNSNRQSSGTEVLESGDGTPNTVLDLLDEQTLRVGLLKLEYSGDGTTEVKVEVYDEPDGTVSGDLSDMVDQFHLSPGERAVVDVAHYDYVEDDVVALADGGQDSEVAVTVGGSLITG